MNDFYISVDDDIVKMIFADRSLMPGFCIVIFELFFLFLAIYFLNGFYMIFSVVLFLVFDLPGLHFIDIPLNKAKLITFISIGRFKMMRYKHRLFFEFCDYDEARCSINDLINKDYIL